MKQFSLLLIAVIASLVLLTAFRQKASPVLTGAWGYGPADNRTVMIITGNVFSVAQYTITGKTLLHSWGGTWRLIGNQLIRQIEWDSQDSTRVGKEVSHTIQADNATLKLENMPETWQRLDDGGPGELAGAWIITGTYNNDKVSKRPNPFFPRRTMKVLSGKYFHWIAYHLTNKQFLHAGGGTYSTAQGKYTENIEFFTKTPASVGKSLSFDYSFVDGDWRHRGEKSTGGLMDECWTKRETLENR